MEEEEEVSNNKDGEHCHLRCTAKLDEVYPVSEEEAGEEKAPVHLSEVLA